MKPAIFAVNFYLEFVETVICLAVAIVVAILRQSCRFILFCINWRKWQWQCELFGVSFGFDLQNDWDDLEVVWLSYGDNFFTFWCRMYGWVTVTNETISDL